MRQQSPKVLRMPDNRVNPSRNNFHRSVSFRYLQGGLGYAPNSKPCTSREKRYKNQQVQQRDRQVKKWQAEKWFLKNWDSESSLGRKPYSEPEKEEAPPWNHTQRITDFFRFSFAILLFKFQVLKWQKVQRQSGDETQQRYEEPNIQSNTVLRLSLRLYSFDLHAYGSVTGTKYWK